MELYLWTNTKFILRNLLEKSSYPSAKKMACVWIENELSQQFEEDRMCERQKKGRHKKRT